MLLPQVATEYGWDRYKFLDNTCIKAALDHRPLPQNTVDDPVYLVLVVPLLPYIKEDNCGDVLVL